jgi:hypothetical protein
VETVFLRIISEEGSGAGGKVTKLQDANRLPMAQASMGRRPVIGGVPVSGG